MNRSPATKQAGHRDIWKHGRIAAKFGESALDVDLNAPLLGRLLSIAAGRARRGEAPSDS